MKKARSTTDAAKLAKNVGLYPEIHAAFDEYCRQTGREKKAALNKLVKWFCGQDHTVQSLLMDRFSQDDQELLVHSVLSRLAKPPPSSSSRRTG